MKMKQLLFTLTAIVLLVVISACSKGNTITLENEQVKMATDSLPQTVSQESDVGLDEALLKALNPLVDIASGHFAYGDLTGDGIDEIALYIGSSDYNSESSGSLEIYSLEKDNYSLLATASMNYDITNYAMRIGYISEADQGIILNNKVGAQSGVTYVFLLRDNKLINVVDPRLVNVLSVEPTNYIEDVDNDGILEFSVLVQDPESTELNDNILLWYKWNGKMGADLVFKEGSFASSRSVSEKALDGFGEVGFLEKLYELKDGYNSSELSFYLKRHIDQLNNSIGTANVEIDYLFQKDPKANSSDDVDSFSSIPLNRLNDISYLSRKNVLKSEEKVKAVLVERLKQGYKLNDNKGLYYFSIDYGRLISMFEANLSNEYKAYLRIMEKESNTPYLSGGLLNIEQNELAQRLVELESFKRVFSYSQELAIVNDMYNSYIRALVNLNQSSTNFNEKGILSNDNRSALVELTKAYPDAYFSFIINELLSRYAINNSLTGSQVESFLESLI